MKKSMGYSMLGIFVGVLFLSVVVVSLTEDDVLFSFVDKQGNGGRYAAFCSEGFTGGQRCSGDGGAVEGEYRNYECLRVDENGEPTECECTIEWRILEECEEDYTCEEEECISELIKTVITNPIEGNNISGDVLITFEANSTSEIWAIGLIVGGGPPLELNLALDCELFSNNTFVVCEQMFDFCEHIGDLVDIQAMAQNVEGHYDVDRIDDFLVTDENCDT